jgi:hypothetical protein
VLLYSASDAGQDGFAATTYARQDSSAADKAWWGSVGSALGRETTVGGAAEHAGDVVIGLDAGAPVTLNGLCIVDDFTYQVLAIGERRYGVNELQVIGLTVDRALFTLTP